MTNFVDKTNGKIYLFDQKWKNSDVKTMKFYHDSPPKNSTRVEFSQTQYEGL